MKRNRPRIILDVHGVFQNGRHGADCIDIAAKSRYPRFFNSRCCSGMISKFHGLTSFSWFRNTHQLNRHTPLNDNRTNILHAGSGWCRTVRCVINFLIRFINPKINFCSCFHFTGRNRWPHRLALQRSLRLFLQYKLHGRRRLQPRHCKIFFQAACDLNLLVDMIRICLQSELIPETARDLHRKHLPFIRFRRGIRQREIIIIRKWRSCRIAVVADRMRDDIPFHSSRSRIIHNRLRYRYRIGRSGDRLKSRRKQTKNHHKDYRHISDQLPSLLHFTLSTTIFFESKTTQPLAVIRYELIDSYYLLLRYPPNWPVFPSPPRNPNPRPLLYRTR